MVSQIYYLRDEFLPRSPTRRSLDTLLESGDNGSTAVHLLESYFHAMKERWSAPERCRDRDARQRCIDQILMHVNSSGFKAASDLMHEAYSQSWAKVIEAQSFELTPGVETRMEQAWEEEDLCFATYIPSTGSKRSSGIITEIILPEEGEREVHGNVGFTYNKK